MMQLKLCNSYLLYFACGVRMSDILGEMNRRADKTRHKTVVRKGRGI